VLYAKVIRPISLNWHNVCGTGLTHPPAIIGNFRLGDLRPLTTVAEPAPYRENQNLPHNQHPRSFRWGPTPSNLAKSPEVEPSKNG
jgi:hypothetical protein